MTRILYLTGSHAGRSVCDELELTSTQEAAERVLDGNIPVDGLHGFMAVNWAGRYGEDCTAAVANIVADGICRRWYDDSEFGPHLRAVVAWTESVLCASWDHDEGEFRDSSELIAALNASRGIHHLVAAE